MESIQALPDNCAGQVGGQFDQAISQVQNAPKKAKKKIPPDTVPKLQENKQTSCDATGKAQQQTVTAKSTVDSNPIAQQAARGQLQNLSGAHQAAGLGNAPSMATSGMGGSYSAPSCNFSGG